MDKFVYPKSIDEFKRNSVYQVKEPLTNEWSEDRYITHLCDSMKNYLILLIKRKGVRIVQDDK